MIITINCQRGPSAQCFSSSLCTAGPSNTFEVGTRVAYDTVFSVALAAFLLLLSYNVDKFSGISIFPALEFSTLNLVELVIVVPATTMMLMNDDRVISYAFGFEIISGML